MKELSEQELEALVQKWTKIGRAYGPSNDDTIRQAVKKAYENAGLPPVPVIIVDSPYAVLYVLAYVQTHNKTIQLLKNPSKQVLRAIEAMEHVCGVPCPPKNVYIEKMPAGCDGQYESYCLAAASTDDDAALAAQVAPFVDLAHNACFWLAGSGCAIVSRRAVHRKLDALGNLHSMDSPAMEWGDGYKYYAIHGVFVPAQYAQQPLCITASVLASEPNAEVRQALMLLALAAGSSLDSMGLTIVDSSGHGLDAVALYEVKDDPTINTYFLELIDHTPEALGASEKGLKRVGNRRHRVYYLQTPKTVKYASEAVSGLVGLPHAFYNPMRET